MKNYNFDKILPKLEKFVQNLGVPVVTRIKDRDFDPFKILIGTILSLRTKDETTEEAANRLFEVVKTPEDLIKLSEKDIEKLIYPVGFYKRKAKQIKEVAKTLIEKYDGRVPNDLEELLKLKGVGRKTANLVITEAFDDYGICVDTHVHRISNRLGWVKTKNPEQTEMELRKILPKKYWKTINPILVTFGQNICKPISPLCSKCPIEPLCPKIGVTKSR
ncbi:endonuclease III domain-containing protein [Caldisericum exile]|uniref:Endonuclease III n=1 Tax=Caldisericum exile (strain DSM 21853 / NBRC 104410 / AZM16c01) TaxID=511051 RepID=A0A7U6GFF2_CALEA|nr:endonuclease III [Caldisericum exile]BAL81415.1 putative DNA glycosylase/AP lyase [Caldisericum exile AZM16c01]